MKVEVDLPEIEGYEYTGEYREPKKGEYILGYATLTACMIKYEDSMNFNNHILKKVEPSLVGMLCELWNEEDMRIIGVVVGFDPHSSYPYETDLEEWKHARPLSSSEVFEYLKLARELDGGV